jgi:serine/threonine-protein kinase
MSPEQIMGRRVDHKADIYSFGALTYEIITKRPPFIGTTERSIFEKHINRPPAPMKLYVKTISEELDNVVQKMLIKKAEERLQSITEVIYYISKWEKKETVVRKRQVSEPRTWGT